MKQWNSIDIGLSSTINATRETVTLISLVLLTCLAAQTAFAAPADDVVTTWKTNIPDTNTIGVRGANVSILFNNIGVESGVETLFADGFEDDEGIGAAGSLPNVNALRADFDLTDPVEPNNPNLLAYAALSQRIAEPMDDLRESILSPLRVDLSDVIGTGRINWSSFAGILESGKFLQTEYLSNWPMPDRVACVQPVLMIDCCSYRLTEGVDGSGNTTKHYDPLDLYANEASASAALQEIYAQMPLYIPFTDGDVKLGSGWIYNGADRDPHGSIDYSKSTSAGNDSSFRVRSVAAGTVVTKYWDKWHGNVLGVEHPGPGDFTYRSYYFHLRNGKTNDINMAKTRTVADGDPKSSPDKYLKFANLDNPNDLHWGTNDHAIPVNVGDSVSAQQQIAWSGNTGPGGAGAGLNQDGTPKNTTAANNHLHFMVAASHPVWTNGEWLFVDPYGVYEQQSTGCYDLLQPTEYDRLLAPFYPYFHGVDLGVFNFYLYYYGQMGRSPATFTVQHKNSDVIAAGAFKSGLGTSWHIFDYMTPAGFQTQFDILTNAANNFRLVDHTVLLTPLGQPRHNGIFRPDLINDWFSFGNQTIGDYSTTFDNLTEQGYDLLDFFGYHEGNVDRVASIFAPWPGDFIHHGLLNSSTFTTVTNDHAKNGWLPIDINVMEMANGTSLSAIYRQTGDLRMVHWGMTSAEYQQWMDFYLSSGWDLEVVQNYSGGNRYAAIWSK